jgi:hypothetical protein
MMPEAGNRKFVGFYWTLPVPWAQFTKLSREADVAAKQSRTIRYQRELIRARVRQEGGRLVGEFCFMEVEPDRASDYVRDEVALAAKVCREQHAQLLYVDFSEGTLWRRHVYLKSRIEAELGQDGALALPPEPISVDGVMFDPARHFKSWRSISRHQAVERRRRAISEVIALAEIISPGAGQYASIAERLNGNGVTTSTGRLWSADNVKKVLQRLRAKI